jgi:hypothetical protein
VPIVGYTLLAAVNFKTMFNSKKVFITIEFADIQGLCDYPKHLPIPQKEDVVHFDGKFGKVEVVKHMTEGTVTDIRIKCCRL